MAKIKASPASQKLPSCKVVVLNRQKDLKLSIPRVRGAVLAALEVIGLEGDEITLHLVTRKAITKLHGDFFGDPTLTDCITFPGESSGSPFLHLGDLFVCPYQALLYAAEKKSCPYKETLLYIVHTLLHIKGYEDIDPKDRKRMKQKEKEVMEGLSRQKIALKLE